MSPEELSAAQDAAHPAVPEGRFPEVVPETEPRRLSPGKSEMRLLLVRLDDDELIVAARQADDAWQTFRETEDVARKAIKDHKALVAAAMAEFTKKQEVIHTGKGEREVACQEWLDHENRVAIVHRLDVPEDDDDRIIERRSMTDDEMQFPLPLGEEAQTLLLPGSGSEAAPWENGPSGRSLPRRDDGSVDIDAAFRDGTGGEAIGIANASEDDLSRAARLEAITSMSQDDMDAMEDGGPGHTMEVVKDHLARAIEAGGDASGVVRDNLGRKVLESDEHGPVIVGRADEEQEPPLIACIHCGAGHTTETCPQGAPPQQTAGPKRVRRKA